MRLASVELIGLSLRPPLNFFVNAVMLLTHLKCHLPQKIYGRFRRVFFQTSFLWFFYQISGKKTPVPTLTYLENYQSDSGDKNCE